MSPCLLRCRLCWAWAFVLSAVVFWPGACLQAASQPPGARLARPNSLTESCVTDECHVGVTKHKVMHGPAAQNKCMACHKSTEPRLHQFALAAKQEQLCLDCHTMQHRTVVHSPVKQGNCTGCHDAHGSEQKWMLVADPTQGLCIKCHKPETGKKHVHGPVATGACIVCHDPHSSWESKLLVSSGSKLCLECHSEVAPKKSEVRHVHAPAKDNCVGCHDPHASDLAFQLKQSAPELCFSCHKDISKQIASNKVVHGAVQQAGGCTSCHTPHSSTMAKLQRTAQPESCLKCHNQTITTKDGQKLTNMAALLKDNPRQHGPIREGACTACHQPHAGENFRLLVQNYPAEFYAPFKIEQYALCFGCHIPDLVLKPEGTGLTRFRNGDTNLHWLHVNKEKGRTCRACHEVHASRNPFHIRDSVPFGAKGWAMQVNYSQSDDGGSCAPGCHMPQRYDRGDKKMARPNEPAEGRP